LYSKYLENSRILVAVFEAQPIAMEYLPDYCRPNNFRKNLLNESPSSCKAGKLPSFSKISGGLFSLSTAKLSF